MGGALKHALLNILFTFRMFEPVNFVCTLLASYNLLFLQVLILGRYETFRFHKFHFMF